MQLFLTIFYEFFKTGLFSVGGGLATLPFLFEMSANHPDWFSVEQLTNMVAISESTPGPIGVNISTYVGFTINGIIGALYATFSLVLPSLIVILIVAGILEKFRDNKTVKNLFYGLRPAVVGMLAVSLLTVAKTALFDSGADSFLASINLVKLAVFAVLMFGIMKFKKHPIIYIIIGAIFGIIFKF